ncbi:hypothetical protein EYZ11_009795 [Aspergillus tanneri]|uniref:Uncharacterized protein n=1 Tax=Aspergillus tanneri TaxID=1220188 RepID=A0A4S3J933_9EURO|nr:hypothetical protein EYZ11_009795 [Aspergillus tanneri]
MEGLGYFL